MKSIQEMSIQELLALQSDVQDQLAELYWSDENFYNREEKDSYVYIVVYDDLTYHYDYIGERAYREYLKNDNAIRIECKTKTLFPTYKVLMQKVLS